eukprot:TRINITY_DN9801_c1_g1_i2.p1 TRINITY_DN9801_c1_g1~~TRINITY_DN9801_c1_g1_i2.p1  ORF type:complete len:248 (-),score=34.76 TRINITY_DN9801_c1_g1_i2:148-891(-)
MAHLTVAVFLLLLCLPETLSSPKRTNYCALNFCENGADCEMSESGTPTCICPKPTPLSPNFFRGKKCEAPAVMCADTTTFYCSNGATCVEIVEGEDYECQGCPDKWGGPHCDVPAIECGRTLCYNDAECSVNGDECACPPDWTGPNCSIPIPTSPSDVLVSDAASEDDALVQFAPLLGALGALVMFGLLGAAIFFVYRQQQSPSASIFFQLQTTKFDEEEGVALQQEHHRAEEDAEDEDTREPPGSH